MKKQIIILAAAAMSLQACNPDKGKSVVEGSFTGAENQKVYLDEVGLSAQSFVVDSADVESDGSFRLVGKLQSEPTFYNVRLADGRSFAVVLDSAQTLHLTADASASLLPGNVTFENSEENDNLQKVMVGASDILAKIKNGTAVYSDVKAYKDELTKMILANPRSMVSYYIVFQQIGGHPLYDAMDKEDVKVFSAAATSLQLAYPNSTQVKYLCDYTLSARALQKQNARRDSLMQTATKLNSPDLAMPDKEGNEVRLTSLRGKTVLLYFWAAADENSANMFNQLKSTYNKYHNRGLEIYAVSFDTAKLRWEATINGTNWVNVCDFNGTQSFAAVAYNVTSIPSNYIIAPDGQLIGKDLFGTRLDNKLAEILR